MLEECPNCYGEARLSVPAFTRESWDKLVAHGHAQHGYFGRPICKECAAELRDILIEEQES